MLWDLVKGFVHFSPQDQRPLTNLSSNIQVEGAIFTKLVGAIRVLDQQTATHCAQMHPTSILQFIGVPVQDTQTWHIVPFKEEKQQENDN